MAYTKVGPFVDGGPPYLSAADLNVMEAGIATANTVTYAPAPSGDTTGVTDQAVLQPLISAAQSTGGTIALQAGTYYVTGLTTAQSFNQPRILGQGMKYTTLSVVGSGIGVTMVGGSGLQSGGLIADLSVTGAAATGIELAGPIGVKLSRIRFNALTTGLRFHNRDSGSFTEFCVADDCAFESNVTTQIEYKRTNGNDSFHGTGFRGCVFVQASTDTGAKILVGSNCKVYDAPWDADFFLNTATPFVSTGTTLPFMTYGTLRFESVSTGTTFMAATGSATWWHAGHTLFLTQGTTLGGYLCEQIQANNDGSMTIQPKPFERHVAVGTGTTVLTNQFSANGSSWIVGVTVTAANYEYHYDLLVYRLQTAAGGTVTTLANPRSFNTAGYGAPTFAVDSSNTLTITNASYPATGVAASIAATPLNFRNVSTYRFAG